MAESKHMTTFIDIVFDGPPSHESGRFVEVENDKGQSIKFGEWIHRGDGFWVLRFNSYDRLVEQNANLIAAVESLINLCPNCFDGNCTDSNHARVNAALAAAKEPTE